MLQGLNHRTDLSISRTTTVGQEPCLFKGTVAENIAYGLETATREQIIAAAKAAHAHSFISEFTNGYDTDLAEGSINLSGGQKQRIGTYVGIYERNCIMFSTRSLPNGPTLPHNTQPLPVLSSKTRLSCYWTKPPLPWTMSLRDKCRVP